MGTQRESRRVYAAQGDIRELHAVTGVSVHETNLGVIPQVRLAVVVGENFGNDVLSENMPAVEAATMPEIPG